jgi:toxin ParE1/3/4
VKHFVLSEESKEDLAGIWAYHTQFFGDEAQKVIDEILEDAESLRRFPEMGRTRNDFEPGLRCLVARRDYLVFYTITTDAVVIVRVIHGSRNLKAEFDLE